MVDRRIVVVSVGLLLFLTLSEPAFGQIRTGPLSSFSERITLLNLRSSLGIRSKEWPIKGDPCLIWDGIRCENGSVAGINISGFKRTRIGKQNPQFAVDPLANLSRLSYFNSSKFTLPGSIPDWFGLRLTTLQVLDLSSCNITGVIPVTLGNLTGLQALNLSDNKLTGSIPGSLGELLNLSVLDLSKNSLTGSIPATFSSLGSLSSLDVSTNYLTGPILPGIGSLLALQHLNLSDNSFSSSVPPQLGNLTKLVDLDLSVNSLSGSLPALLKGLTNLQRILIGDNFIGGSFPGEFATPSRLQVIVMRHNSFTGILPDKLWSLPELRVLDVSGNNFTGVLPNSSVTVNQAELNISHNMFYGRLSPVLSRFRVIDLSANYFEGKIPDNVPANNDSIAKNCLQFRSNQRTVDECSTFYTQRGLIFDGFGNPNSSVIPRAKSHGLSRRTISILAAVAGGAGLALIFLAVLIALCVCKKRRTTQGGNGVGTSPAEETPQPGGASAINFSRLGDALTYQQLLQATSEFNNANLLKHGHSGDIFDAVLDNGIHVVIKRINIREDKREGNLPEVELLSRVSHQRLVPILGHCLENENQKFLVYKFMRNRDLASSLFRKPDKEGDGLQSLDWITRLKIALGAAEALAYLHHECSPPIVHRDVQASSILLDDKFEVRLGSLSEAGAQESGIHQSSRITRFLRLSQSSEQGPSGSSATGTCAYDVYCFGKVLLELVTGKLGISDPKNTETKEFLEETLQYISSNEKALVTKILDPSLIVDEDLQEEVWAMAIIAKSCLNPKPSRRPQMRHIFNALENPVKIVRDETSGSGGSSSSQLRRNASRGSWNAGIFGSWRHSSSKDEAGTSGLKKSGSQGSGQNNGNSSSSRRRQSNEIVPEPSSFLDEDV